MTSSGRSRRAAVLAVTAALLALSACSSSAGAGSAGASRTQQRAATSSAEVAAASTAETRVVATGDIACPAGGKVSATTCQQGATAKTALAFRPDLVLTLGDHQYQSNSLAEYQASYARSWGQLLAKTRPTIGNHEYLTPGAAGYFDYFRDRQPGPPGYYRVTTNGWNVYVLNSNCTKVSCSTEAKWLDQQMAAHPSRCSLVTMHHPRYSSGLEHGNNTAVRPLWAAAYKHRNDVVLSGHDHDYERFARMDGDGHVQSQRGMMEFVAGAGGNSLYHLGTRKAGSAYFQASRPGVLEMLLKSGSYSWAFKATNGTTLDSGSRSCL
jgi:hypothetical protein